MEIKDSEMLLIDGDGSSETLKLTLMAATRYSDG